MLRLRPAVEQGILGLQDSLGQVCEALLPRHGLDFLRNVGHVIAQLGHQDGIRDHLVFVELAVPELNDCDTAGLLAEGIGPEPLDQPRGVGLHHLKARLRHGTAAVDRDDEIHLCDADLVADTDPLIAQLAFPTLRAVLGWALTVGAAWREHLLLSLAVARATHLRAHGPIAPITEDAIPVARARVARSRLLHGIASLSAVPGLLDLLSRSGLDTAVALLRALREGGPVAELAVDRAFHLGTLRGVVQRRAGHAPFVAFDNDLPAKDLDTTLQGVVALDGALPGDPISNLAIDDISDFDAADLAVYDLVPHTDGCSHLRENDLPHNFFALGHRLRDHLRQGGVLLGLGSLLVREARLRGHRLSKIRL
mmetsp:Transcript_52550/g.153138  ORF Transcript_52550/g.153138 Transcript_52550/m.153138 type:complete len:367 (+) Transcript_52550:574-1674(+)